MGHAARGKWQQAWGREHHALERSQVFGRESSFYRSPNRWRRPIYAGNSESPGKPVTNSLNVIINFLGAAIRGHRVGVRELGDGLHLISLGPFDLGYMSLKTKKVTYAR
jgi:hypothetical protein